MEGFTTKQIAKEAGVSKSTVMRIIAKEGITPISTDDTTKTRYYSGADAAKIIAATRSRPASDLHQWTSDSLHQPAADVNQGDAEPEQPASQPSQPVSNLLRGASDVMQDYINHLKSEIEAKDLAILEKDAIIADMTNTIAELTRTSQDHTSKLLFLQAADRSIIQPEDEKRHWWQRKKQKPNE